MKRKLVLASQSPRRRELMTYFNLPFDVVSPSLEEVFDSNFSIETQVERVAISKAENVFELRPENLIIGADTVVVCDGEILGKPKSPEVAVQMLQKLSGKTHEVYTGVSMISKENKISFVSKTNVTFYDLNQEDIDAYVATKDPLDKAGAYSIQSGGALFIKNIEGDFYTVMGLPIGRIHQELLKYNW